MSRVPPCTDYGFTQSYTIKAPGIATRGLGFGLRAKNSVDTDNEVAKSETGEEIKGILVLVVMAAD